MGRKLDKYIINKDLLEEIKDLLEEARQINFKKKKNTSGIRDILEGIREGEVESTLRIALDILKKKTKRRNRVLIEERAKNFCLNLKQILNLLTFQHYIITEISKIQKIYDKICWNSDFFCFIRIYSFFRNKTVQWCFDFKRIPHVPCRK